MGGRRGICDDFLVLLRMKIHHHHSTRVPKMRGWDRCWMLVGMVSKLVIGDGQVSGRMHEGWMEWVVQNGRLFYLLKPWTAWTHPVEVDTNQACIRTQWWACSFGVCGIAFMHVCRCRNSTYLVKSQRYLFALRRKIFDLVGFHQRNPNTVVVDTRRNEGVSSKFLFMSLMISSSLCHWWYRTAQHPFSAYLSSRWDACGLEMIVVRTSVRFYFKDLV